ncbi:MAG: ATPase with chaperone activity [Piscinibacter sp.]|nr:ATPase with chaperone activity [Piscinibacter sp.]
MTDDSQLVVPPSFVALFVEPGRLKPNATREHILARYEHCEDLATLLTEHARTKRWELGVAEDVVLARIHQGLRAEGSELAPAEADWVLRRLAELLEWDPPAPAGAG